MKYMNRLFADHVLFQVLIFFGETLLGLNWAVMADILLVSLNGTCGKTIEMMCSNLKSTACLCTFFYLSIF